MQCLLRLQGLLLFSRELRASGTQDSFENNLKGFQYIS